MTVYCTPIKENRRASSNVKVRQHAIALAIAMITVGPHAWSQSTDVSAQKTLEKVIVTGSNIKRTDMETASPVTVLTREDLKKSGAVTLGDVITNLTVAQGGLSGVEFSGFTPGAATVSLRGLGDNATLVLINGRRIAPYGITGFQSVLTSINAIPVSAIDRIDILKDGASAIYGSDAIAGVLNIIMRRDFQGTELGLTHTRNQGDALNNTRFNAALGKGDLSTDRYNIFAMYEHVDVKPSTVAQNKFFPSRNINNITGRTDQDFRSTYSVPGNVFGPNGWQIIPGTTCQPNNIRTVNGVDRCVLDVFDYNTLVPKVQRDSIVSLATYEISKSVTGFTEISYNRGIYEFQHDPQFYYNNSAGSVYVSGQPYNMAGNVHIRFRAGDIGPRKYKVTEDTYRILTGIKGAIDAWDFDAAIGFMGSRVRVDQRGAILTDEMDAALQSGTYIPGFINSPAVIAKISPTLTRNGKALTSFIDFKANTEFGKLAGGPIGFAAGAELRRENQSDIYDSRLENGEIFGYGALQSLDQSRTAGALFTELRLPFLSNLEGQVAARYDYYSVGGFALTPKFGIKWTALSNLVLRGTYGRGFRVAGPREASPNVSVGYYNGVQDPVLCPVISSTNPNCNLSIQANISGNPDLAPEKSESYTLGLVFEPIKDTSITFDFWKISRKNEITSLDPNFLLANQSSYSQYITRDSSGSITELKLPYVNLSGTSVSGFDLDFKSKFNLGEYGKLTAGASATRYLKFLIQPAPGAASEDYNSTYNQPKFRASAYMGWAKGPWQTELSYNHVGGYLNKPSPSSVCSAPTSLQNYCAIDSWNTFGLYIGYKGFKNTEISLVINNIFNSAPPFDYRALVSSQTRAWSPIYHNAFGRTFQITGRYSF